MVTRTLYGYIFFAFFKEMVSGGSRWGPGGTGPQILPSPLPQFLTGSIVISLSRCCLPNDEGPGPPNIFFLEPPLKMV